MDGTGRLRGLRQIAAQLECPTHVYGTIRFQNHTVQFACILTADEALNYVETDTFGVTLERVAKATPSGRDARDYRALLHSARAL